MVTDPISDMLNRVMNASKVGKSQVVVDYSGVKAAMATVLKEEGYLAAVGKKSKRNRHFLVLDLAYNSAGEPAITSVSRVSKPSRRVYAKAAALRSVRQGLGLAIISTPLGVMTDREARQKKAGGEVLCKVW